MGVQHWFYTAPLRLRSLFSRRQVERDLDDEFQYHVEQKTEEYVTCGVPREEARYAALRDMEGLEQRKEECRDMRGMNSLEHLLQDVRYGLRMFRANPRFTAVAVLTLALGIGANTAIFSVVNAVLLRPLPYPEPDRIVQLLINLHQRVTIASNITSIPIFMVWSKQTEVFEDVAAYDFQPASVNLTGNGPPEQLAAIHASASYFPLFGGTFELGRGYSAEEDRPGRPSLVVLSNGLWHRRFGGDTKIVGKTVLLGGSPHTVIGVLNSRFDPSPTADIWLPLQADPESTNLGLNYAGSARLKLGITLKMAEAQMKIASGQFHRKFPAWTPDFAVQPWRDVMFGDARQALAILLSAVSFVLLIACANVANLLLARATVRQRELAIREALGAARSRIVSQLLTESLLLSLVGGALGLGIGQAGLGALVAMNSGNIPRVGAGITLDWQVLLFALLVSVFSGILFGLLPAVSASRSHLTTSLNEGGARSGAGRRQSQAHSILIVAETALALVLLAGAALLIRTFAALRAVDPGFNGRNVLTMRMSLTESRFKKTASVGQLVRDAERRAEKIPGVTALATTYSLPLEQGASTPFTIEGRPLPSGSDMHGGGQIRPVSPSYFEVFQIPLRRGRLFTDRDDGLAPNVVLINEAMARQFWPSADAMGQRIRPFTGLYTEFDPPAMQIIGIVSDVRDTGLSRNPEPIMYVPMTQLLDGLTADINRAVPMVWVIRTTTEPHALSKSIQRELRIASGGLPVGQIRSMDEVRAASTARNRFNMALLSAFAALALVLSATGIYSVTAYIVQQRTHEIGIRIALGARPGEVQSMVVFQGVRLALIGLVLGMAGALAVTPLMADLLYGVKPRDPGVIASSAVALMTVALLATYIPSRRASQVDPIVTLRWE